MSFEIRQASMLDIDMLAPLFDGYRQFYDPPADLARARDFLMERIHQHESPLLLARDEAGAGWGFTQLYPMFSPVRTWLLNDLFVVAARRQGVAAALLNTAAEHVRALGAASLSLSTALDNVPAQASYKALGWQRDRQFREYSLTL